MKRIFNNYVRETSDGTDQTVSSDPIEPGKVLVIRNLAAYHDNQANTEATRFQITDGGTIIHLKSGLASLASNPVSWQGKAALYEGWKVEAVFPAAANTEVMHLHIHGELYDLDDYRKIVDV